MPWAEIAFGCDLSWWQAYRGLPEFGGLKLSTDRTASTRWGTEKVGLNKKSDQLELLKLGTVGWGGNSGFNALNLAVQFMPAKIILLGFDMTIAHGLHWHGAHEKFGLHNPAERHTLRWRRCIDAAAEVIAALGIRVINCSPISTLQNYPKMTLEEALKA